MFVWIRKVIFWLDNWNDAKGILNICGTQNAKKEKKMISLPQSLHAYI